MTRLDTFEPLAVLAKPFPIWSVNFFIASGDAFGVSQNFTSSPPPDPPDPHAASAAPSPAAPATCKNVRRLIPCSMLLATETASLGHLRYIEDRLDKLQE